MEAAAASLSQDYEALLNFVYIAPVGLAQIAPDGEIGMINPHAAQLLMPLSRDGALGNLFAVLEDVAPELRLLTAAFDKPSGSICSALRMSLLVGQPAVRAPSMLSLTLLKLDECRIMAVISDVTEEVKRERLLRINEAWINSLLTGISDYALVSLDKTGCINAWNAGIARVTGFDQDAIVGQPYSIFYPAGGTTPERVVDLLREADDNGWALDNGWRRRADGSNYWGNGLITPVYTDTPLGAMPEITLEAATETARYCLVIRDISDKREASESLRRSNSCDYLTGIANRRAFFEAAEVEIVRWKRLPRPMSLIYFDADHFKLINDRYGHPAGDAVLRHLADTLVATFRACDVVARIGGEEFAVLLPSATLVDSVKVANRFLRAVTLSSVDVTGERIEYTVSGGVATMDESVSGLDVLMQRADQALYAAKTAGRNCIRQWLAG